MTEEEKQERLKRIQKKEERYIRMVCEQTGWSREEVIEKMERAKSAALASKENYAVYRFWELDEETQKTFFTQGMSTMLRRKFKGKNQDLRVFRDKVACCKLLAPYLGRAFLPTSGLNLASFIQTFGLKNKIVYKPLTGTGGKGVKVYDYTLDTLESVYHELASSAPGLIEEFLHQHKEMSHYSLQAVNTIRVVTVMTKKNFKGIEKNQVHFLYAGFRMASGEKYVDNLHNGGIIADIDLETGMVKTDGQDFSNHVFVRHPDTGYPIKGFHIPFFEEMKEMIKKAGSDFEALLGWDVAITESGPVIIELNSSPGAVILQIPYVMQRIGMRQAVAKYLEAEPVLLQKQLRADAVGRRQPEK